MSCQKESHPIPVHPLVMVFAPKALVHETRTSKAHSHASLGTLTPPERLIEPPAVLSLK